LNSGSVKREITAASANVAMTSTPFRPAPSAAGVKRTRLVVLFRKLDVGGAERQIIEFARGLSRSTTDLTLLSFYDGGELLDAATGLDEVQFVSLRKRGRWDVMPFMVRAWRTIRRLRPDVIYGYQSVANELSLCLGYLVGAKVVWGIRASNMDLAHYDWATWVMFRLGACLSRFADLIIVNSQSGARYFASHGYAADRMVVVPNGINTQQFSPDPVGGALLRKDWDVKAGTPLVGIVARLDPMKDHLTFLQAASIVHSARPDVRFVCVGDGDPAYRRLLLTRTRQLGLEAVVRWTSTERRIPAVMSAIDVLCSSSAFGEGFSNVVGEAMACATPCVVTDVGDSARIVGPTGAVVPPRSPERLASALLSVLAKDQAARRAQGSSARERVQQLFSVRALFENTQAAMAAQL
jgi:glycosyltransferase involved in cell wall biosynthesis